jgi:hypothetical protein
MGPWGSDKFSAQNLWYMKSGVIRAWLDAYFYKNHAVKLIYFPYKSYG